MGLGLKSKTAGVLNLIKRLMNVGDFWYWLPPEEVDTEIPIAPLVRPLRYDILIRKSYFDFYAAHRDLYREDFDAYLEKARGHAYFAWFTRVLMVRFEPGSIGDEARTRELFAARLKEAAKLHDSIQSEGFKPEYPVSPHTAREILPTDTGQVFDQKYYMGDGCHRLACLMSLGYKSLPREFVRVKCHRRLAPLDNTSLLADHLDIVWPADLWEGGTA
jgi:hypothetical protein